MNNVSSRSLRVPIAGGMLAVLLLAGCATTAPKASFVAALAPGSEVRPGDTTKVTVEAAPDVSMLPSEKTRLAEQIEALIAAKQQMSAPAAEPRAYAIEVTLTKYEKGNAFARAMLAGLGQIHIDGDVKVYLLPAKTLLGEFTVKKTFAWGGIYGGVTSMETIEKTLAEGIAAAVTGQAESETKK